MKRKTKGLTDKPRCGLCGKTKNLTKTECCRNWICDDEGDYVMFSYARNSCSRNHRRYTLCGFHSAEEHTGSWKECEKCRHDFEAEMYVWYGTNEYNFEKLENPPAYDPTHCSICGKIIRLGEDGYTESGDEYWCESCAAKHLQAEIKARKTERIHSHSGEVMSRNKVGRNEACPCGSGKKYKKCCGQ